MKKTITVVLAVMALLFSACGTTNPPLQQITQTDTVINQASQIGGDDYAPLELREARKKLDDARSAFEEKDYDRARRLAEQARVDAELAQIKTMSGKAQKAVFELRESIRLLKEEIEQRDNRNR